MSYVNAADGWKRKAYKAATVKLGKRVPASGGIVDSNVRVAHNIGLDVRLTVGNDTAKNFYYVDMTDDEALQVAAKLVLAAKFDEDYDHERGSESLVRIFRELRLI